jgi:hypothetical protein
MRLLLGDLITSYVLSTTPYLMAQAAWAASGAATIAQGLNKLAQ